MSKFLLSLCDSPSKMQSVEFSPSSFFRNSGILATGKKKIFRSSMESPQVQSRKSSSTQDPYEFVESPVKSSRASLRSAAEEESASSDSGSVFEQQQKSQIPRPTLYGITDDEEDDEEDQRKLRQSMNKMLKTGKPSAKSTLAISKRFHKPKSHSAPHTSGSKLFFSRTSMSSPPKKQRKFAYEPIQLGLAGRAKRSLDYEQGKTSHRSVAPSEDLGKSHVMGEIGRIQWSVYEAEKENIQLKQRKVPPTIFSELDAETEKLTKGAKHYGDSQKSYRSNNTNPEAVSRIKEETTEEFSPTHTWPSSSKKYPAQKELVNLTNVLNKKPSQPLAITSSSSLRSEEDIKKPQNWDNLSTYETAKETEISDDASSILPIFKDLDDADSELVIQDDEKRHCSRRSSESSEPEYMGFPNPDGSNLCWLNSGLQILLAMTPFVEDIERLLKSSEEFDCPSLLQNFIGLVRTRRKGKKDELHNFQRKFLKSLFQCCPQFKEEKQHDAGEFLSVFFEKLHESLKRNGVLREQDLNEKTIKKEDGQNKMLGAGEHSQDFWSSPLKENLQHVLKEAAFCLSCSEQLSDGAANPSIFIFQYIPEHSEQLSLQQILEQREIGPQCECKCGASETRTGKMFSVLPRFLFFQMLRYDHTSKEKLGNSMTIPLILSLEKLVDKDVSLPASWEPGSEEERCKTEEAGPCSRIKEDEDTQMDELTDTSEDSDYKYHLMGVILHEGPSIFSGHFRADVFSLEKQKWYHYNDESVFPKELHKVLEGSAEREGYVFLYIHKKLFDQMSQLSSRKIL